MVFFPVAFDLAFVEALYAFIIISIFLAMMVFYTLGLAVVVIKDGWLEEIAEAIKKIFYWIACPIIAWVEWADSKNLTNRQTLFFPLLFLCTILGICLIASFHSLIFTTFSWVALGYGLLCFSPFLLSFIGVLLLAQEHVLIRSYRNGEHFCYCPSQSNHTDELIFDLPPLQSLETKSKSMNSSMDDLGFAIGHYFFIHEGPPSIKKITETQRRFNISASRLFEQGKSLTHVTSYVRGCIGRRISTEERPKALILLTGIQQIHQQYQEARRTAFLLGGEDKESSIYTFMHSSMFDKNLIRLIFEVEGSSSQTEYEQIEELYEQHQEHSL